jgi:pimeloyl-ACP methyl ester carboxylesterase
MSSILDHPLITARYFFPRREFLRDAFVVESGDVRLACYHHAPHRDVKTVVYFHGNGEVVADCVELMAEPFASLGLNSFFIEYRGYGMSTGVPELGAMLDDVPKAIAALGIPQEELILFGRSVGSIYALHATQHLPKVAGLVIESGIADPLERILLRVEPEEMGLTLDELTSAVRQRLNHKRLLAHFKRPTLFMHTRYDGLIDVDSAERMHAWANDPKDLLIFERGDHNSILMVNFEAYMTKLKHFLESIEGSK